MMNLLLMHGAIGSAEQLIPLATLLSKESKTHTLNFSGHGGKPYPEKGFSIKQFASEAITYLDEHNIQKTSLFGYSMGGYVAMYMALHYPERIDKIITLGTKYEWTEAIAAKEILMLDPEKIEKKLPQFAESLKKRHEPNDWKTVLAETARMMINLGNNNEIQMNEYKNVNSPVLILIGDSDKMVSIEETESAASTLPYAALKILHNTPHPIEQIDLPALSKVIHDFLK